MQSVSGVSKALGMLLAIFAVYASIAAAEQCTLTPQSRFKHSEMGEIPVLRDETSKAVVYASQMQVDTDGAPDSYHPDNIGITHLCNGVSVGPECQWKADCLSDFRQAKAEDFRGPTKICFFGMATNKNGEPVVQGASDPKPGYFVSTTALKQPGQPATSQQAQLDSDTVPYVVIPGSWQSSGKPGPKLGDVGAAYRRSNGKVAYFIVGDVGPRNKLGEGSVALHQALGNSPFVTRNGVRRALRGIGGRDIVYVLFPDSRPSSGPYTPGSISDAAKPLFDKFGGIDRLQQCTQLLVE
jgi:hypothetical protein